jgi:hypothetical protein
LRFPLVQDRRVDPQVGGIDELEHPIPDYLLVLSCVEGGVKPVPLPGELTPQRQQIGADCRRLNGDAARMK